MTKIAVLVSGGGTNLQALIDAQQAGKIENGQISLVISSNPKAYALERAAKAAIPSEVLRRKDFSDAEEYGKALTALLENADIGLIVLAGFMTVLPDSFCRHFENRIINVHPSLIPPPSAERASTVCACMKPRWQRGKGYRCDRTFCIRSGRRRRNHRAEGR